MYRATLAILAALFASIALAVDFKTSNGKEYKNSTVTRVEPDGIVIKFHGGIVKLQFTELPSDVQKKYGYAAAAVALRASEEKKLAEKREAQDREGLKPIQKAGDLDEPAVKKPTIRSEAERGFNASLSIGFGLSIIDRISAGDAVLDRNIQANSDTEPFRMGLNVGLYLNLKFMVPHDEQEAGFQRSALGMYASEVFKAQSSLGITDAQMDEIFSDRIMAIVRPGKPAK